MRQQGTTAAVIAVLAALWVGTLAEARRPDPDEADKAIQRTLKDDDVKKDLKALRDDLENLKQRFELDRQAVAGKLSGLDRKLDNIERMLRDQQLRRADYFNPAPAASGTIRLDNRLGVPASVTIDGTTYTVAPFEVRELPGRPAGSFLYDVTAVGFGVTPAKRATLPANKIWTLTIS